jgi:hypothetical protein
MRPKFVIICLLVVIGAVWLVATKRRPAPATSPVASRPTASAPKQLKAAPVVTAPRTNAPGLNSQDHAEYVKDRSFELYKLSAFNDNNSLLQILAELNNPDKEIRAAALEATRQFGSRDAIPTLVEQANHTEDPREKVALLDAAEWLKLTTLTEYRARMKAKREADLAAGITPTEPTKGTVNPKRSKAETTNPRTPRTTPAP